MALLIDKVAVVTGGARGIGKAIALKYAEEGAKVAIVYNQSIREAKDMETLFSSKSYPFMAFQGSVTDLVFIREMVKKIKENWGRVDILVNNAGIIKDKPLLLMSEKDWDDVVDTNLKSAYFMSREVLSLMINQKYGRIISIASLTALMGREGQTNYGAAKAGLIGFTKSLAREVAPYNILVNSIAAGLINTRMIKKMPKEMLEKLKDLIPLGRVGEPEEIAQVALFLGSDMCSYVTGTVMNVTGGEYM